MKSVLTNLCAGALLATLALPGVAAAQGRDEAVDDARRSKQVREVVRGFYVKANAGSLIFIGPRGGAGVLEPGTSLGLSLGQDFIDKEKSSAAWEVMFHQSLNNGLNYTLQSANIPPNQYIQGDVHTFTGALALEYSVYLSRRLGIGARAGGGVSYSPLLMDREEYLAVVVNDNWGGVQSTAHDTPLPLVFGGPTVEYYTKLSHFSIGLDASFAFYIGLDFGIDATGFLKYTF